MAGSRLEKLGTVFSRVRDLLRAGIIKQNEKPVWYDVYAAFPPKRDPLYEKPLRRKRITSDNVPSILYKEDIIRATFFEAYGNGPRAFELSRTNFKSTCQRFVEKYAELQKNGEMDENKLFEETGKALLAEGIILRRKGTPGWSNVTGCLGFTFNASGDSGFSKILNQIQNLLHPSIEGEGKVKTTVRPQHPQASETQDPLLEMNLKKMLEEMQQQQEEKTQETKDNPTP